MIEVNYHRGLYLPEIDLWLDPQGVKPRAFVSHAHADHFARHESVLCSETTATLLQHRFKQAPSCTEALGYHAPLHIGQFRLRLLPAGHIPGSAMLHVTRTPDNATLLYTGDFKMRRSRTAQDAHFLTADTLIMETTFGLPHYTFPNPMEVEAGLLGFIHDCFADGRTPVLLAYSLGKTQEALAILAENEIPALLHPAAAAMTHACREAGVPGLPQPLEFKGEAPAGHVVIAPPHAMKSKPYREIPAKRTAMLSGWALQPNARFRYGVDVMIPFSDHADHPGLLECIQRVRPKRVLTVHGYAKEFANELRSRGYDAWCAAGGDQLELPIHRPTQRPASPARAGWHNRVLCQLADFTDLCRLVEQTGSRVSKVEFIANYLKSLEQEQDLRHSVNWLGQATRRSAPRALNAKTLRHMLLSIPGTREERYVEVQQGSADEISAATTLLQELPLHPEGINLAATEQFLAEFSGNPGSIDQLLKLSERLITLHPAESETLLRLLSGKLRIDIDLALLEEALARSFGVPVQTIRQARHHHQDLGQVAIHASRGSLMETKAAVTIPQPPASAKAADQELQLPIHNED